MNSAPLLTMRIRQEQDVVAARQRSRRIAELLGFDAQEQTRIATAVSEIARNAFRYAHGGKVEFLAENGITIRISDNGPGIPNVQTILQGRYKSETGMGLGIIGARRLMDEFHIDTSVGVGVIVTMRKSLPKRMSRMAPKALAPLLDELARDDSRNPYAELDIQNRELLQTLEDLERRQDELNQLNRELEDTNRGVVALYAELDEKAESLRQADRLKSTFLSHMSHEFRTPLNSIVALSKILMDRLDGPLTEEQAKQVNFIHGAAQELTDMVNDLLDLAKVEAGKIEIHNSEFDVGTLLSTLRGMMRPLLTNPNVQMSFEYAEGLPGMCTDEAKVAQILRNFLSNAIKFTERGEIRVACSYDPAGDTFIFAVSDTGPGIPPEEQERIFQQYYQIDSPKQRKIKGTGLGLPLSKKLAELLGGSIQLRSEVGVGSQFSVRLPRRLQEQVESLTPAGGDETAAAGAERPLRILVIDDEDVARYLVRKALVGLPAEVEEAHGGVEGIRRAREPNVDLIVLDLVMSDATGFQVIAALEAEPATRNIPVVIHTSMPLGEAERGALSHARAIISKSRTEPELRDVVKSLVAGAY